MTLLMAVSLPPFPTLAAPSPVELTAKTWLAYAITGDHGTDATSAAGLKGLAGALEERTTLDDVGVTGVDVASDALAFFPLIYWPLNGNAAPLSPQATQRVNDYLRHGGMIVFDTQQGTEQPDNALRNALSGIALPPLVRVPEEHVLTRSFYLLSDFPGRFAGNPVWIEPEQSAAYDGVASMIVGSNGWAAAWAVDGAGQPLYPCIPDGERQREYAYRFGVNLVMLALTGSYKADQIHAKALLERKPK